MSAPTCQQYINVVKGDIYFKEIVYKIYIYLIENKRLKFEICNEDLDTYKYQNIYELEDLRKLNEIFKVYDNIIDVSKIFKDLIAKKYVKFFKNIKIKEIKDNELIMQIEDFSGQNIEINLNSDEPTQEEKINYIYKKLSQIDIKNQKELHNNISKLSKEIFTINQNIKNNNLKDGEDAKNQLNLLKENSIVNFKNLNQNSNKIIDLINNYGNKNEKCFANILEQIKSENKKILEKITELCGNLGKFLLKLIY